MAKAPRTTGEIVFSVDYDPEFHPSALAAMALGTASEHQQREGMKWILEGACALYQQPFVPGDPHATSFMAGRIYAGQRILTVMKINGQAIAKAKEK